MFSKCKNFWVDKASGSLYFKAVGASHGELLETFFIVDVSQVPDLYSTVLKEKPSPFDDNKWKPKTLQIREGSYVIEDPMHIATVNGRKKMVVGKIETAYDASCLHRICEVSVISALFEVSNMTHKDSKEVKRYKKEVFRWENFCKKRYDFKKLAMKANELHYRLQLGA